MRFHRTKLILKILCVLCAFVVLRLLYLMVADHSLKQHLALSPFPETVPAKHAKTDERIVLKRILKDGVRARILKEKNDYYVLNVLKKSIRSMDGSNYPIQASNQVENDERSENELTKSKHFDEQSEQLEDKADYISSESISKQSSASQPHLNCPNNTLHHSKNQVLPRYGKCKPHKSSNEDCLTAQETYTLRSDLQHCDNKTTSICNFVQEKGQRTLKVTCDKRICKETEDGITVKGLDSETGGHADLRSFSSIEEVEKYLPEVVKDHEYVFLGCSGFDGNHKEQLSAIPPLYKLQKNKDKDRPSNAININIILIDSVARSHFYRSLPNTIQLFKHWTKHHPHSPAEILDFELFQSVEGHTAENVHALFTGTLFPGDRPRDEQSPSVGMETMFGHFEKNNYQTMWQEDLCWEGVWGLMTDLAIEAYWTNLEPKLKEVHIHRTGMTHASCEILKNYGLVEPFNGPPDNKICYNGIFNHNYFLQYLVDTLKAIQTSQRALPLLSYLMLSVGHDQDGLRIQTLDKDLVNYSKQFAMLDNTLTLLLADHGNTYTDYTVSTLEGRFEMFHPSFFAIVPNGVAKLLGEKAMNALRINQRRLITLVDLHHTLMTLANPVEGGVQRKGLFAPISSKRTCNDVELRTPNLCVCDNWDSPTVNDTGRIALVEFAVGQLNNKIQKNLAKNVIIPLMSSCVRLQPIRFESVRERNTGPDGGLITSFDIVVRAGNIVKQDEDIFRVEVKSTLTSSNSLNYKLIHYERLTMFGKYKKCADKSANVKLCVCNKNRIKQRFPNTKTGVDSLLIKNTAGFFKCKVLTRPLGKDKCINLIKRVHGKDLTFAFEVANFCLDKSRDVLLLSRGSENMKFSVNFPLLVTVPAGGITFAFSATKNLAEYDASFDVKGFVVDVVRDS